MSRFAKRPWVVLLVFVVLAAAALVVKNTSRAATPNVTADAPTDASETTGAVHYKVDPGWPKTLPPGRPELSGPNRQMGSTNGDVAVSSKGEVYVSVEAPLWRQNVDAWGRNVPTDVPLPTNYADPVAGLQVYAPDGTYLRNVPNAPKDLHGFIIHKEPDGEFIYGVRTAERAAPPDQTTADWYKQAVVKMTLDGKMLLTIPASAIPEQFKNHRPDGIAFMRLTDVAVGPNGDLYVSDGYGSDYIHRFDRNGKYLTSFGGKKEPYDFSTLHKLALDTRFTPPRLIATDRAHNRMVHLSLDGEFLGVIIKDMLLPAAVAIWGDYAYVGGLRGPVTLLDKAGKVVTTFGTNTTAAEAGNRLLEPAKWRPGILATAHGIAVNEHGDVFVSEFNVFGRVNRFTRQ